ncbi:hypothetical protein MSI_05510 [Treponema sp. JC4]|uniref:hypothetical protein n=1 Tax=Treponema sp. JC4 TaxID=1124982 RepID=UPI00025B0A1C|nr:hypothetical protein [Treponema sp. JC4]EID85732.1 hypothetical protein MSI_05510 [Treponema sp. JC4]
MNEQKIKEELIAAGATEDMFEKIDFAKFEEIFDNASSIDDLCRKMKAAFPDFDEDNFRTTIQAQTADSEKIEELSDDSLEGVAGGSAGSWLNKNKDWIIPVGLILAAGAAYMVTKYVNYRKEANWTAEKLRPKLVETNKIQPSAAQINTEAKV